MFKRAVRCAVVFAAVAALSGTAMAAKPAAKGKKRAEVARTERRTKSVWQLTASAYSFHDVTFAEAIDKIKDLPLKYVEGFSWQKISPKHPEQFNHAAPAESLQAIQKKLKGDGIGLIAYYVGDWGKDDAAARKHFEFCKTMGIQVICCEPKPELLDTIDGLAKEFKIKVAIHNHPQNPKDAAYTNWDPEKVMNLIKSHSKWIGTCADTGHWVRSGLDPVACLKKYEGRIFEVHLKDVDKKGADGKDVVWGTGVANAKGQLEELNRQKFSGPIVTEYESNIGNNIPDLRKCVEFYDKTVKELGRSTE